MSAPPYLVWVSGVDVFAAQGGDLIGKTLAHFRGGAPATARRARTTALSALLGLCAVVLLCRLAAAAPPAPSPEEILTQWAIALGGRVRLAALRSVHLVARLEVGDRVGRFETWYTAGGARRDVTEIPGLLRQENVFDGTRGWMKDASGKVRALAGAELEDQVTSAYQATYAWLLPGRLPGDVALTTDAADHSAWVFAIRPRHGTSYTVFLDPQTFLPLRLEQHHADRTSVQTLSGWRDVGGIRFPGRARQSSGDHQLGVEFVLETIEFDATLDPRLFAEPQETPAPVERPSPGSPP